MSVRQGRDLQRVRKCPISDIPVIVGDVRSWGAAGRKSLHSRKAAFGPGCVKTLCGCYDSPVILLGESMRRFVEEADRGQWTLLPECLDDFIDGSGLQPDTGHEHRRGQVDHCDRGLRYTSVLAASTDIHYGPFYTAKTRSGTGRWLSTLAKGTNTPGTMHSARWTRCSGSTKWGVHRHVRAAKRSQRERLETTTRCRWTYLKI